MGLQDVVFLPLRASFYTTFIKNCGRGEIVGTTMCVKTVFGGRQGHAPCKILWLQQSLFYGDDKSVTKL